MAQPTGSGMILEPWIKRVVLIVGSGDRQDPVRARNGAGPKP